MAFSTALANLQDKCACFICLDLFKNAVTIPCGHNFCRSCICLLWEGLNDNFPCPVCQISFPQKRVHKNPQIQNLVDIIKNLQRTQRKWRRQEECTVCPKHNQPLALFCMQDLEVLCIQCSFSEEHQTYHIYPMKRAAFQHRKILEGYIESLQYKVKEAGKVLTQQYRRALELRKKFRYKNREISVEFEQVKLFLQNEHEALLNEIHIEELVALSELKKYVGTLSDYISTLEDLLKKAEAEDVQSDITLLTCVPRTYNGLKHLRRPEPWSFRAKQYGLSLPPQYSCLDRIIKQFQIDVTFDLDTAHPQLVISKDRKSVFYSEARQGVRVCGSPQRFLLWPALLGSQGLHSGRCYWEVKVGNESLWTLGVCQDCLPGDWSNQPSVAEGFWAIGKHSESGYVTYGPKRTELLPVVRPSAIGIFLDYDLGELSFYNMNDRSLLYTFSNSFTSTVWPYFCTETDSEPLKILPIPPQA
ncbi:tripartite motif-containing protein 60-like [Onychomys torridus]|uniref:tripartite motif-containing protein 60-like n=1 Tax=Onychomys torridus TaxID=38674 RepID=UPI00167F7D9A|nr:tripartite motif-containing protein 60-like [Onychomys torridus]